MNDGMENMSSQDLLKLAREKNETIKELLVHFRQLQEDNQALRGKAPAPAPAGDDLAALRAENERLRQQVGCGAADSAEVMLLRERTRALEATVRELRQRCHDTELRARANEKQQHQDPTKLKPKVPVPASAGKASPASKPEQSKISTQQAAGMAATMIGGAKATRSDKISLNLEGYLQKQGGGWGLFKAHFKERYFELRGAQGVLYYSAKKGAEQLGEIPLEQTTCAEASIRPFSFCLFGPLLPRTYILAATSREERNKWMEAITHAADHYTKFISGAPMTSPSPQPQAKAQATFLQSVVDDVDGASLTFAGGKDKDKAAPQLSDFEIMVVVGVGSFGKVLKVRHKPDGKVFAMKVLQKDMIVKHRMVPHTKAEKDILEECNHPFVVKMHYAFQTRRQLVFILDFLTGGELFYHLVQEHRFSEDRAKFYAVEIALALEHLHARNIIYRDLKPENLVLDSGGHVCLTDFGLAKTEVTDVTHTFCGTPQYMAPELILKQGHGRAADWWSLGVFLFEMIAGVAPFPNNGNVKELYEAIVSKPPPFPQWMSPKAKDFLSRILNKDPAQRVQSIDVMMKHPFFKDIDAKAIEKKQIPVPFKPQHKGDDTRYVDNEFKRESCDIGKDHTDSKEGATIVFDDFTFVRGRETRPRS
eukprot:TRINITY_DN12_c0_g7_i1.p1 TRINITY_DN12_c0_g7~~TRINITY_DN12_c0_g7_i1.p1  ORF type:complete len:649 (+),score=307.91 TRINITY_DN12_c0_g7_i1:115-2061(+)